MKAPFAKLVDTIDPSFTCYHTILPGTALTPEAGGYVVSVLKVPSSKQGDLSAAFARYLATVPEDSRPAFMAIAVSREDNEAVVNFSGYPSKDAAQAAMGASRYASLRSELKGFAITTAEYQADLRIWTP